jgi:ABC-type antimicrobial peptide transport system permease subunit
MNLTLIGVIAGISATFALVRWITSLLFGVSPTDVSVIGGVTVLLTLVALIACLIPACRAASIDPIKALRAE